MVDSIKKSWITGDTANSITNHRGREKREASNQALEEFTRGSAMAAADASEKLALIRENLAEILNPEIIEKILDEGRHPKIYWGMFGLERWDTGDGKLDVIANN